MHRGLATHLTRPALESRRPRIDRNIQQLRNGVTGQPHLRNLDRWTSLLEERDLPGLHRVLTGLDRDSIEMREVSPLKGLLPHDERAELLASS
ncbi:hypothetical protein IU448_19350 [Nocardia flavorosea]|uniref:hypothetical protein n=1 Tax=Nocardia flavorosea TaxID=53429 RepID=UPI0018932537|nr:hypothetical protein [Nocardia flavorosea]MBF6351153.1 hypothetical protein [Nocardia flavorosea]